jgi:GNAT superfamily N-acetyltransferase
MKITIEQTKDASLLARLNKTVQDLHAREYPQYFKPYQYDVVEKEFEENLAQDNWYAYVAFDDSIAIGYILFFIRKYQENPFRYAYTGIHIDQLSVLESYQRKGIGSKLMNKAEEVGKIVGATQIELTYWDRNIEAKAFYDKKGFEDYLHFIVKKTE